MGSGEVVFEIAPENNVAFEKQIIITFSFVILFLKGVWSSYFPNIYTEHVHPFCSKSTLRLCDVCKNSARSGRGKNIHHFHLGKFGF